MDKASFYEQIDNRDLVLLYLSSSSCGVCSALLPKIQNFVDSRAELSGLFASGDENRDLLVELSVFTFPAVLLFARGKEVYRAAGAFGIGELAEKVDRLIRLLADDN